MSGMTLRRIEVVDLMIARYCIAHCFSQHAHGQEGKLQQHRRRASSAHEATKVGWHWTQLRTLDMGFGHGEITRQEMPGHGIRSDNTTIRIFETGDRQDPGSLIPHDTLDLMTSRG